MNIEQRARAGIRVGWVLIVMSLSLGFLSVAHHLAFIAMVNGACSGAGAVLLTWNRAILAKARESPPAIEVAQSLEPSGDDELAREIEALAKSEAEKRHVTEAEKRQVTEDSAIIDLIAAGKLVQSDGFPEYGTGKNTRRWGVCQPQFDRASVYIYDPDIRECYRKYMKAMPVVEGIMAQRKLLESP